MNSRYAVAAALCFVPALASAQAAPDFDSETIVVTGQRLSKEEAKRAASSYTRDALALPPSGQYARWKSPVCVRVLGLSNDLALIVTNKIKAEAQAATARVAKPGCKPNIEVVFTDDADRQVSAILKRSARIIDRNTSSADMAQLTSSARPVRWWSVAQAEGINGHQLTGQSAMMLSAQVPGGSGPGINSRGNDQYLDGYSTTLIGSATRSSFESLYVIVDLGKAEGRLLSAVAAYVSLVSLAQIRMGPASSRNTVKR